MQFVGLPGTECCVVIILLVLDAAAGGPARALFLGLERITISCGLTNSFLAASVSHARDKCFTYFLAVALLGQQLGQPKLARLTRWAVPLGRCGGIRSAR